MNQKEHIILDLDQTLISAEPTEEYDFKNNKAKSKKFTYHNMDDYYIVFERPGLQDFLDYIFKNFNVSIWTAASKDYAMFVVDKIIIGKHTDRKINFVFFSHHCGISKKIKKGTKDISILWSVYNLPEFSSSNTFILDDYDEVYKTQPNNCIIAKPFEFNDEGSEHDTFLKELLKKIKNKKIKNVFKKLNK
jgi:TFIIF-interacting CTD phosphatase-like protein